MNDLFILVNGQKPDVNRFADVAHCNVHLVFIRF